MEKNLPFVALMSSSVMYILEFVNVNAVCNAVVKTFLNVLWGVQKVCGVTFLERVFHIESQTRSTIRVIERCCADDPSDVRVNSNFAVDLVFEVGGGERWVEREFHA
jgi:hypothetical protein